ncbi:transcription factor IIA, alpha/beta subunit [Stachybotrys elegans]|uniref:Transcription initiation factor IIA large subunit n=1 Tax=Stachybotrys elegans TaxID=80388 RepID=A0A8K0ST69_9HYPO|nr:transcription factor IIA, alpha/beta subunit [Stachybotrys elegans]
MSNQAVGGVYQTIIEEVINSSRVDFEESGVEEAVLEELRQGWQQKLSQLDVAVFPWDPKPEPPAPAKQAPTAAPAQPTHSQGQPSFGIALPNAGPANGVPPNAAQPDNGYAKHDPQIKPDPAGQPAPGYPAYQNYNSLENKNNVAASRAQQQLQAQYGNRAAGSISAIQQQHQPQAHGQPQNMGQGQQMYHHQQMANTAAQQPPAPGQAQGGPSDIRNGQTDGAADELDDMDYEGVLLQRSAAGTLNELGRVDIDRMLHGQMLANAKAMEGGGLMLPLKEVTKIQSAPSSRSKGKGIAPYDGNGDDDDEIDEDAINSDLDDPDEDRDDEEVDDEGLGNIMLCMYDKVQRVKNKWKCTLKDGVLTVNGKEYVFHKATGEYEW